jgi:general secretion pathway protein H
MPLLAAHLRGRSRARARAGAAGLTLIELMVCMVLIALVMGAMVFGTGSLATAKLKKTASGLTGMIKVAYTRATATSRSERIVMDLDNSTMWLEESDAPMLVQTKDLSGSGGASAQTKAEQDALAAGQAAIKGPNIPRPSFRPVSTMGVGEADGQPKGPQHLPEPITFRQVQTAHDDEPKIAGRAYLYFWPGGLTERTSIELRIRKSVDDVDTQTLLVSPLTGKVTVKNGPVKLVLPTDDKSASEREDRGGF